MLNGFHGSGKDTLGKLIIDQFSNYKRYAFADKVKDLCSQKYGFDRKLADIHEEKDKPRAEYNGLSIRDLGREMFKECDKISKTFVSEEVARSMMNDMLYNENINFIITDFRYAEDYYKLCDIFGKSKILTINIKRDSVNLPDRNREPEEYALENFRFDLHIENNREPEYMLEQMKMYCN